MYPTFEWLCSVQNYPQENSSRESRVKKLDLDDVNRPVELVPLGTKFSFHRRNLYFKVMQL